MENINKWIENKEKDLHLKVGLNFLNQYAISIICEIFNKENIFGSSKALTIDEIIQNKGYNIATSKRPLELMCNWLCSKNILEKVIDENQGTRYMITQTIPSPDLLQLEKSVVGKTMPGATQLLKLPLKHANEIFLGEMSQEGLYAQQSVSLWQSYFSHPGMSIPSEIVAEFIYDKIKDRTEPVTIMEVGAGSANGTRALYELLASKDKLNLVKKFIISDFSTDFIENCEKNIKDSYGEQDIFEFKLFDLNISPTDQGLEQASVDFILGVNCLHYIKDWSKQFQEIHSILKWDGWLLSAGYFRNILEKPFHIELHGSFFEEYHDVILNEKYRPEFGIMTPEIFQSALIESGYCEIEIWPPRVSWENFDFYCGVVAGKKIR
ncbi:class I SAM-dependent methyltransferase [Lysinibacillus sp. RC79]|uniref:class I SAM-dependent methyltransferase n=1 Tax=Lysinibacillus sp. RC79 TaxID=3156296 RepID=UPI0035126F04